MNHNIFSVSTTIILFVIWLVLYIEKNRSGPITITVTITEVTANTHSPQPTRQSWLLSSLMPSIQYEPVLFTSQLPTCERIGYYGYYRAAVYTAMRDKDRALQVHISRLIPVYE